MSTLQELSNRPSWEWPDDAPRILREALRSGVESAQIQAAELVGEAEFDDSLAEAILEILSGSGSPELRAAAAISLGPAIEEADLDRNDSSDEKRALSRPTLRKIVAKLEEVYRDATQPTVVRRRLLEASVRSPQDWHPDAVRAAWKSGEREWVATSVFCMGYVKGFDREIVEAMSSTDGSILQEAVRAAGLAEVTGVERQLIDLTASRTADRDLRLTAIEALGGAGTDRATDILYELADSHDSDIAEAASEALGMLEGSQGFDDEDPSDDDAV